MGTAPTEAHAADPLAAARAAAAAHRWSDALALYEGADANGGLTPEDLDRFGEAAWWAGRLTTAIAIRERAYAAHLEAGNRRAAAGAALAVANDYAHRLQSSLWNGWVGRAERLLATEPESTQHGLLGRARLNGALGQGDLDTALRHAQEVLDIAERLGDRDLEALALQDKGRVLVARGEVTEGLALLDEAVVAAIGGELAPYPTAVIYCNATVASQDLADYRRAAEFSEAARRWCDRQAISGFPGMCRVRHAEVTRLKGAWAEAEAEARQACAELADFCLDYAGEGFYQIGEIRLRVGDLKGAEEAFRQAHEFGRAPLPGVALLRLAQGRPEAAISLLRGALDDPTLTPLGRARLLPAMVEVAAVARDLETAEAAATEMERIATDFGTHPLRAAAAAARGELLLRQGNAREAMPALEEGRRLWHATDAPYETARVRCLIAEAAGALEDRETAALELDSAAATFVRLGAEPDAQRVRRIREALVPDEQARSEMRTLMFTDIVSSTDLVEAVGDEAWADVVSWHDRTVRALVASHGGEEIDHAGDGFFVAFADPVSALACARELQNTLARHRREHGFAPQVRIGIHEGSAMRAGGGYKGRAVHMAARIAATAGPGEVVASEAALQAAGGEYAEVATREVTLKGVRGAVRIGSIGT